MSLSVGVHGHTLWIILLSTGQGSLKENACILQTHQLCAGPIHKPMAAEKNCLAHISIFLTERGVQCSVAASAILVVMSMFYFIG